MKVELRKWLKFTFLVGVVLFFVSLFYLIPALIDQHSPVHLAAQSCDEVKLEEKFCEQRYFDDGLIRLSVRSNSSNNCCLVQRENLDTGNSSFRIKLCAKDSRKELNCRNYQGYGSEDYWIIDGERVYLDRNWPGNIINSSTWEVK